MYGCVMRDLLVGGALVSALVIGLGSEAIAEPESEFYIVASTCKGVAASSGRLNSLKEFDDDSRDWACSHTTARKLSCLLQMKNGTSNEELLVDLDTVDALVMHSASSSYWFWIDRTSHVATFTVRMVEGPRKGIMVLGTSVCQAAFLTADEASQLAKKKP
jgi:hypothetical protein